MRFLVDPYSAPPYVKLHCYERVGGECNNFEAIKLLKFATVIAGKDGAAVPRGG